MPYIINPLSISKGEKSDHKEQIILRCDLLAGDPEVFKESIILYFRWLKEKHVHFGVNKLDASIILVSLS